MMIQTRSERPIPRRMLLSRRTSTIRPFTAENRQSHYPIAPQIPERHCRGTNSKFANGVGHNVLYIVRVCVFFERRITRFAQVSSGQGRNFPPTRKAFRGRRPLLYLQDDKI